MTGGIVALCALLAFSGSVDNDDPLSYLEIDHIWRLIIGFGAIPGLVAIYFRMTIPETPRFTMEVKGNVEKAVENVK